MTDYSASSAALPPASLPPYTFPPYAETVNAKAISQVAVIQHEHAAAFPSVSDPALSGQWLSELPQVSLFLPCTGHFKISICQTHRRLDPINVHPPRMVDPPKLLAGTRSVMTAVSSAHCRHLRYAVYPCLTLRKVNLPRIILLSGRVRTRTCGVLTLNPELRYCDAITCNVILSTAL